MTLDELADSTLHSMAHSIHKEEKAETASFSKSDTTPKKEEKLAALPIVSKEVETKDTNIISSSTIKP